MMSTLELCTVYIVYIVLYVDILTMTINNSDYISLHVCIVLYVCIHYTVTMTVNDSDCISVHFTQVLAGLCTIPLC